MALPALGLPSSLAQVLLDIHIMGSLTYFSFFPRLMVRGIFCEFVTSVPYFTL
jgi:hypothetical protein